MMQISSAGSGLSLIRQEVLLVVFSRERVLLDVTSVTVSSVFA